VVICLEQGADLHMAQLMPLPLTVSCFSKIQIGFIFLVPAHLSSPGKGPLNWCECVCSWSFIYLLVCQNVTYTIHRTFTMHQAGQTGGCTAFMSALNLD